MGKPLGYHVLPMYLLCTSKITCTKLFTHMVFSYHSSCGIVHASLLQLTYNTHDEEKPMTTDHILYTLSSLGKAHNSISQSVYACQCAELYIYIQNKLQYYSILLIFKSWHGKSLISRLESMIENNTPYKIFNPS